MSPRTRRTADTTIAITACALLVEAGAGAVTFAQVAKRCGLAPPTLVQRFGSRLGLLQATAAALAGEIRPVFERAAASQTPSEALRVALRDAAPLQWAAMHLARDTSLEAFARELRMQISFALARAIEAGALPRVDVARTARIVQIAFAGAVAQAGLENRPPDAEVATAIDALLADYV